MARRVMYTPNLVQSGKPVILVMWSHRQHTSGSKRIVNRATTKSKVLVVMLEIVNHPEVSERLGWTPVLLRIFGFMPNFKQRITLRTLEMSPCLYAPAYTEHLHFEPGNAQAFCRLLIADCL